MKRLAPIVYNKSQKKYETILEYYDRFVDQWLIGEEDWKKEYRRKLLGPDLISAVPPLYEDMIVADKVGFDVYDMLSLSERGKLKAFYRIKNYEEIIIRHKELSDVKKKDKQYRDDNANKNKAD